MVNESSKNGKEETPEIVEKREKQVAKLRKWMRKQRPLMLSYHLSRKIAEYPSTIHRIMERNAKPNTDVARKIDKLTKGHVAFEGWY